MRILIRDHIDDLGKRPVSGLSRVTNQNGRTRRVKLVAQLENPFQTPGLSFMPCILYNGNQWGSGNSPKGRPMMGETMDLCL